MSTPAHEPAPEFRADAGAGPSVHIEDQGPPDQYGRVEALVRFDGVVVARLQYQAWREHLVIYTLTFTDEERPPRGEIYVVQALLSFYEDQTPDRITHSCVQSLDTVKWYADCHLAPGLMVCGSYGSQTLFYDPLDVIDLSVPPVPMMEGFPAATITVMYVHGVREFSEVARPTLEQVHDWMVHGNPLGRFVAIRRLVCNPHADPDVVKSALYLGLLNENSGVRQFSAIHLGGYFPELGIHPDIDTLHRFLRDPLEIYGLFGKGPVRDVPNWNAAHCRRNGRYAIGWTLGNICWNAMAWGAAEWADRDAARVRELLVEPLAAFTPERDKWLMQRAIAEFTGEGDERFGLGGPEPIDLFDFLRFSVLRWKMVQELSITATDRFYWLVASADGILGRPPSGEPDEPFEPLTPAAHRIHADRPDVPLPDVSETPEWLFGTNHYEVFGQGMPVMSLPNFVVE
jgi:hypothetical protein